MVHGIEGCGWHYGTGLIGALQLQKPSGVFTIKRQFITIPVDTDLGLRNISELQVADQIFHPLEAVVTQISCEDPRF